MSETPPGHEPAAPDPPARGTTRALLAAAGRRLPLGLALGGLVGLVVKDLDLAALTPYNGSRELLVVLVAVAVASVWAAGWLRLVAALAAGSMVLWAVVAFTPLCPALAAGLVRSEMIEPADAVFVSFAGISSGELAHSQARSRVLRGVELLARRKAPLLVVPGADPARLGAVVEVMQLLDVGTDRVVTLPFCRNTHEEALALGKLYRERGWRLVIVVTSPLHSGRAGACLARENVRSLLAPSEETRFDLEDLSRAADRISAFGSVIHERMGRFVYDLRGWS